MNTRLKIILFSLLTLGFISPFVLPHIIDDPKKYDCINSSQYTPKPKEIRFPLENPTGEDIYNASLKISNNARGEPCHDESNVMGWTNETKWQKFTIDFSGKYDREKVHTIAALWDEYKNNVYVSSIDSFMVSSLKNSKKEEDRIYTTRIEVTLNTSDPQVIQSIKDRMEEISREKNTASRISEKSQVVFIFKTKNP